jgi:hypothetical protein
MKFDYLYVDRNPVVGHFGLLIIISKLSLNMYVNFRITVC